MKKQFFFAIIGLMTVVSTLNAQDFSRDFTVISKREIDLTTYDKDPEADAVILFDKGESLFADTDNGFEIQFTREKRLKILKESAIDYAEVRIPYYSDGNKGVEQVVAIEGYSYNFEEGRLIKKELDSKGIFTEKINEYWNVKKFVLPDVKPGTIIEYKYVLKSPFHFNLPDWEFQSKIPTVFSKYVVKLIPFYEYAFLAQGIDHFDEHTSVEEKGVARVFGAIQYRDNSTLM